MWTLSRVRSIAASSGTRLPAARAGAYQVSRTTTAPATARSANNGRRETKRCMTSPSTRNERVGGRVRRGCFRQGPCGVRQIVDNKVQFAGRGSLYCRPSGCQAPVIPFSEALHVFADGRVRPPGGGLPRLEAGDGADDAAGRRGDE